MSPYTFFLVVKFAEIRKLPFYLHNTSLGRFGICCCQNYPSIFGCMCKRDEWNDGMWDWANNSIKSKLILKNPHWIVRISYFTSISVENWWRTRLTFIYESHKIISNEKCLKLKTPKGVVGGCEFEGCLGCNIYGIRGGLWLKKLMVSKEWEEVKFMGLDVVFYETTMEGLSGASCSNTM